MKNTMILVVMVAVFITSTAFARHGGSGCQKQSRNMDPTDALIWTMANPNECDMDFLGYARQIKFIVEKMSDDTLEIPIINKLLIKHVGDLERRLSEGKGEFTYLGALDYEDNYEHLLFFKKKGFKTKLDELALLKHLHNKIADVCTEEERFMKSKPRDDREMYRSDIAQMRKRIGESK